ncbi:MAG TPA: hypothetical protein VK763_08910 [Terriglobales bacterium]|jgi:hypothetical protein|nr:hypothetical protein [Terriglobales bacterium]
MSQSRLVRFGNVFACTILVCTLAFAGDQKSPTKLSDLPPEAQHAISAALARHSAGIQDFTLTASDGVNDAFFGYSVAIEVTRSWSEQLTAIKTWVQPMCSSSRQADGQI